MKTHERFADPTQKTNQTVEVDVTPYISDDFQERIQRPHPISDRHKVEFKRLLDEDVRLGFLISVSPSYKVIHTNPAFVVKSKNKLRIVVNFIHLNKFTNNEDMPDLSTLKFVLLHQNWEVLSVMDIAQAFKRVAISK